MPAKLCEGMAVKEEQTLGGSAGRCAGGGVATSSGRGSLLVMPQQGNLVVGKAQLRIGD